MGNKTTKQKNTIIVSPQSSQHPPIGKEVMNDINSDESNYVQKKYVYIEPQTHTNSKTEDIAEEEEEEEDDEKKNNNNNDNNNDNNYQINNTTENKSPDDNNIIMSQPQGINFGPRFQTQPPGQRHYYYYHHKPHSKNNILCNIYKKKPQQSSADLTQNQNLINDLNKLPKLSPLLSFRTNSDDVDDNNNEELTSYSSIKSDVNRIPSSLSRHSSILNQAIFDFNGAFSTRNYARVEKTEKIVRSDVVKKIPPFGNLKRSKSAPSVMTPKSKHLEFFCINAYVRPKKKRPPTYQNLQKRHSAIF